ncbi:MAG: YhcH/YjgK/YiaL family protein [Bacteriovoracaceae bacterium]|nr:YhcH/YjgK/YiaL family protein [Bacteriovoracaceae bacterium]
MFYGTLPEIGRIFPAAIADLINKFVAQDGPSQPAGHYELLPQRLAAQVAHDPTQPWNQRGESHQKFLDVHFVQGVECLKFAFPENCILSSPYDADRDVTWWKITAAQEIILRPPQIVIFFPGEIHAAGITVPGIPRDSKVVFKVAWP